VENLIISEAVVDRRIDLQGNTNLVNAHHDLDRRRNERIVAEFAETLEIPEILADVLAILSGSTT
jgi:hypothetical protein